MSKLNSEAIKQLIVDKAMSDVEYIISQFCIKNPQERLDIIKAISSVKNWKRQYKRKSLYRKESIDEDESFDEDFFNSKDPCVETYIDRRFDCTPLDDQLRAYVFTDETDSKLLKLVIQGE